MLVVAGVGWMSFDACERESAIADVGRTFLSTLGRGEVDDAYTQLSASRRAAMTAEAFAALTDHPTYRAHREVSLFDVEDHEPGYCALGAIEAEGGEWGVQLFFLEEGDGYRVHSFAIQAPAPMQLGTLLPECGYWQGTLVGYRGPPVERATPPTP